MTQFHGQRKSSEIGIDTKSNKSEIPPKVANYELKGIMANETRSSAEKMRSNDISANTGFVSPARVPTATDVDFDPQQQ